MIAPISEAFWWSLGFEHDGSDLMRFVQEIDEYTEVGFLCVQGRQWTCEVRNPKEHEWHEAMRSHP